MKAKEFLDKAATHMQDRASTYDKPQGERSMAATVGAFNAINGTSLTEEQGWMFMELLKIVRSIQGDYKADNYEDAVAYAALRGECASVHRGEPLLNQMVIGTVGKRMREKMMPQNMAEGISGKLRGEIVKSMSDDYTKVQELLACDKVKEVFHKTPKFMCSLCGAMDKSALFIIHKKGCPNA